ncbi:shikimate dehydrogenase [Kineococcus xinjiangensis]|uniref:Shikimate dehydrogenase n=1 Tax=Kineococcus xinjiangensis TaxID=512762 RepID=A0A2S6IP18_9ACTN|nr:shikimate dehydrogenase [Kineococcus xinjiangensis]PPK95993.1 shikimate dehydrogenase [Kineococcus xinjiangensis]
MRAAVCGSPIRHSLSPVLHTAAYEALGLADWSYGLLEVDEQRLPEVVGALDASWAGLSLTMPLKEAIVPLVDEVSDFARAVGSVNTVVVRPRAGGVAGRAGVRLLAENTDVEGLVVAVQEAAPGLPAGGVQRGVVLGGGATARSALVALLRLGCPEPVVLVRSEHRAGELRAVAPRLDGRVRVLPWSEVAVAAAADVVISTVPAGGSAAVAEQVLAGRSTAGDPARWPLLVDVVYAPWPTPLASAWPGEVVGGFEMLLHQAAAQVRLMTGLEPPVEAMRRAGASALTERAEGRAG